MNSFIDLLTRHRSIRKFKPDPIPGDQLQAIVASAQMASTSSSVQAYTIIAATDPALKKNWPGSPAIRPTSSSADSFSCSAPT